jgi:hypothetical protein
MRMAKPDVHQGDDQIAGPGRPDEDERCDRDQRDAQAHGQAQADPRRVDGQRAELEDLLAGMLEQDLEDEDPEHEDEQKAHAAKEMTQRDASGPDADDGQQHDLRAKENRRRQDERLHGDDQQPDHLGDGVSPM